MAASKKNLLQRIKVSREEAKEGMYTLVGAGVATATGAGLGYAKAKGQEEVGGVPIALGLGMAASIFALAPARSSGKKITRDMFKAVGQSALGVFGYEYGQEWAENADDTSTASGRRRQALGTGGVRGGMAAEWARKATAA